MCGSPSCIYRRWLWPTLLLIFLSGCASPNVSSQTSPLEGNIRFTFEEFAGQLLLKIRTEDVKTSSSVKIDVTLLRSASKIEVVVGGLVIPQRQEANISRLYWQAELGALEGKYELIFVRGRVRDHYTLAVTPEHLRLQSHTAQFTVANHTEWLRLPHDAVWLVADISRGTTLPYPTPTENTTYERIVQEFFQTVETNNCKPLTLKQGMYTNQWFISPWSETWEWNDGMVKFSVDSDSWIEAQHPIVQYYRCSRSAENIKAQVAAYQNSRVVIMFRAWGIEGTTSRV